MKKVLTTFICYTVLLLIGYICLILCASFLSNADKVVINGIALFFKIAIPFAVSVIITLLYLISRKIIPSHYAIIPAGFCVTNIVLVGLAICQLYQLFVNPDVNDLFFNLCFHIRAIVGSLVGLAAWCAIVSLCRQLGSK